MPALTFVAPVVFRRLFSSQFDVLLQLTIPTPFVVLCACTATICLLMSWCPCCEGQLSVLLLLGSLLSIVPVSLPPFPSSPPPSPLSLYLTISHASISSHPPETVLLHSVAPMHFLCTRTSPYDTQSRSPVFPLPSPCTPLGTLLLSVDD